MPKDDYIKKADDKFRDQQNTFKNNIGSYATLLEVSTEEAFGQAADAVYFTWLLGGQSQVQNAA
jgi:hypothetical protein